MNIQEIYSLMNIHVIYSLKNTRNSFIPHEYIHVIYSLMNIHVIYLLLMNMHAIYLFLMNIHVLIYLHISWLYYTQAKWRNPSEKQINNSKSQLWKEWRFKYLKYNLWKAE